MKQYGINLVPEWFGMTRTLMLPPHMRKAAEEHLAMEAKTLAERRQSRRDTVEKRVQRVADLVAADDSQWLVWCDLNVEGDAIAAAIPDCVQVKGADSPDFKEKTLNDFATGALRNFTKGRENDDEKHLCPLQLGVIERCVKLWSNPDDTILSPFMGIGSEGYVSVRHNRRFVGCELKPSYFRVACENLRDAERSRINVSDLFSFAENGTNDGLEDCGMEA